MATKAIADITASTTRITVPAVFREYFAKDPRIVLKWRPDGIWPIPPELLRNQEVMQRLARDKEFNAKFEIVAMPRQ